MAKLTKVAAQVFGSSAGTNQLENFGSLAAGGAVFVNPGAAAVASIQALSAWLEGWYGAIVGSNLPAIQDLNAYMYVLSYQVAYGFEMGIPEWDASTVYYTGSLVNSGGIIYISLTDANQNNALTTSSWAAFTATNLVNQVAGSTYVMASSDNGKTFLVNVASANQTFTLPAPVLNYKVRFKDSGSASATKNVIINQHAAETIDGATSITMTFPYGWVELTSDGTNWFVTDQSKNISGWTPFTPVITGFGTVSNVSFQWQRNGTVLNVTGTWNNGTVPATTTGSAALPGTLQVASGTPVFFTGIVTSTTTFTSNLGSIYAVLNDNANGFAFSGICTGHGGSDITITTDLFAGNGALMSLNIANVPIAGWTNY